MVIIKHLSPKGLLALLTFILIAVLACISAVNLYTELVELYEIGEKYTTIFYKNIRMIFITNGISFVVILALFFANNLIMRKIMLNRGSEIVLIKQKTVLFFISLLIAIFATSLVSGNLFTTLLTHLNSTPFNIGDPIFDRDISYYVFQRPFQIALFDSFQGISIFIALYTISVYLFLYAQKDMTQFSHIIKEDKIVMHIFGVILLYFITIGFGYVLRGEGILYDSFADNLQGAGYVSIHVWLFYYRVAPYLLLAIVAFAMFCLWKGRLKRCAITVVCFPACWILIAVTAQIVQSFVVKPIEMSIEQPYIQYNLNMTKLALMLDSTYMEQKEFPLTNDLTLKDIKQNSDTIDNIRILGVNEVLQVANSVQALRSFYRFNDADIVEYEINGKPVAMSIAAREFDKNKLQETAKSYLNSKFKYTHGYGVVMSPMHQVTSEGQPRFIVKDIPVSSFEGAPVIHQPRIYFGELTDDYVIVNSRYKELDYLEGDKTIEYQYQGNAGIPLNFLNRLLFSIKNTDLMLLISNYITPECKLLTNRNVVDRAKRAIPFLKYDDDPYILIDGSGRLKWVLDAYTTTNYFPYSQPIGDINYIRNSVKVIIDAFDGTIDFYITDQTDPIIMTFDKIYPEIFIKSALPSDIARHVRYPEMLFKMQVEAYKKYHTNEPETFYSKSDVWEIATERYLAQDDQDIVPYYNLMSLGEGQPEEMVLMLPFVNKNLVAWMVARSNGQMLSYRFPKGKTVYTPSQIESRIANDPIISKEMSLWGAGESKVFRGNLLVIPVKNSLLYIEPVYITAKGASPVPEVKRVIVAYGDAVAMDDSVQKALEALLGGETPVFTDVGDDIVDVIERALQQFNDMKNFSRELDWEGFGRRLNDLDATFEELEMRKGEISENNEIEKGEEGEKE